MKKSGIIASIAAAISMATSATTTYTITTTASDTYESPLAIDAAMVSVDDGSEVVNMSFSDAKATFSSGAIFRKRGPGYLRGSTSMFTFTGEVRIEEGGYMVVTNQCLGPTASGSANNVVVSNGASLVFCPTKATCPSDTLYVYNAITFEGEGYEGRGALCLALESSCMKNAGFRGNWSLSGDAMIGVYTANPVNALADYLYLNDHVLTYKQKGSAGGIYTPKHVRNGGANAKIVFDGANLECRCQESNKDWWSGTGANELVLTNGAHTLWYNFDARPSWTYVVNTGAYLSVSGTTKYPGDLDIASTSGYDQWGGLRLQTDVFRISGAAQRRGAWFKGFVSGKGDIYATDIWLKFSCPTNAFAGSVAVGSAGHDSYGRGLAIYANGAIPETSTGITITNATTYLGKAEDFQLPRMSYHTESGLNCVSGLATRVKTPSFVKTGNGTLDVSTIPVTVADTLDVRGGTLKLNGGAAPASATRRLYSAVPGLWCGTSPNSGGAGESDSVVYSNFVDSCFTMMSQNSRPPWTENRPTVWGGYIWNRSPTNETWTFAVSAYAMGRIYIDGGKAITVNDNYSAVSTVNKVMTPGPHQFRFAVHPRTYSSPGSKAVNNATYTWATGMGIAIDRYGRNSKNSADYFFPSNNVISGTSGFAVEGGDGSLFTRDARNTNDFTEAELLATARATQVANLALDSSATLDLCGTAADAPLVVGNLTGGGTVANGSLDINGAWTLAVSGASPVELNVTGGRLSFGPSSTLVFGPSAFKTGISGRVIATASEGIVGLPSLPSELSDVGWSVEVDKADSRRLVVKHQVGVIWIIR